MTRSDSPHDMATLGCDTHVHVIGASTSYPMVPERQYTPGPADCKALQHHLKQQGLGRVVIVQPSVYGTDNQCLLEALATCAPHARGIAVLDRSITANALQAMDAQGVRGIRLNFESSANHSADQLQQALQHWGPRLAPLGWHIQVYAPFEVTSACASALSALPVPVVLDHFGLWPALAEDSSVLGKHHHTAQQRMLALLDQGHLYIKLSASYRLPAFNPSGLHQLAHHLLQRRPDRLLWGSDWPHTNREPGVHAHAISRYRPIAPHALIQERNDWLHTAALQRSVLIDNPARLYRFEHP